MRSVQPSTQTGAQANALARDFQNVVTDAQELLKTMGNEGDAKLTEVKNRVQTSINLARQRLGELQTSVTESAVAAAKTTDQYVHDNPWSAVGTSAALGALVGYILARR